MSVGTRSWRLLPLLVVLMPLMGSAYVSCSYNSPHSHAPVLSFSTELDLQDANGQSRRVFAVGELIHMILTVRNRLSETAQVDFSTTRTYDFIVVQASTDTIIWQWSNPHPEPHQSTTIIFRPGETKTFEATWDQLDNDGREVPAGGYEARGVLVFEGFDANPMQTSQFASPPVKFVIE